ncbi:hypothetical protein PYCC9005_004810 [Savitreella phatthalungensis]
MSRLFTRAAQTAAQKGCTIATAAYQSSWGYRPSLAAGIIFVAMFSLLSTVVALRVRRHPWIVSVLLGGILSTAGWIGRIIGYADPCSNDLFSFQFAILVIAPLFFSAGLYLLLGIAIQRAPQHSWLSPRTYLILFCGADLASLIVQAVGGSMAAAADTEKLANKGSKIIVGGIAIQVAAMSVFTVLAVGFIYKAGGTKRLLPWNAKTDSYGNALPYSRLLVWTGLVVNVLIYLRNVYRFVELLDGWSGKINRTEAYILAFDAVPMVLVLLAFIALFVHAWRTDEEIIENKQKLMAVNRKRAISETMVSGGVASPRRNSGSTARSLHAPEKLRSNSDATQSC